MSKEITVNNVNQTVELLFHQATRRNLDDELGEKLAAETIRRQERSNSSGIFDLTVSNYEQSFKTQLKGSANPHRYFNL